MEIIKKIKTFLQEENLTDVKTNDGIILSFDGELVAGVEIFVVDEAGKTPAPDGDYIVDDMKIVVEGGKVKSVEEIEPIEDEPAEAPAEMPAEMPAEEVKAEEIIGLSLEDLNLKIEDLIKKVKKCEEDNLALQENVKVLAESLAKENFKEEVKMSIIEEEKIEIRPLNKTNNKLNSIFKNMYK